MFPGGSAAIPIPVTILALVLTPCELLPDHFVQSASYAEGVLPREAWEIVSIPRDRGKYLMSIDPERGKVSKDYSRHLKFDVMVDLFGDGEKKNIVVRIENRNPVEVKEIKVKVNAESGETMWVETGDIIESLSAHGIEEVTTSLDLPSSFSRDSVLVNVRVMDSGEVVLAKVEQKFEVVVKRAEDPEERLFASITASATKDKCADYRRKYPNGRHIDEVNKVLGDLIWREVNQDCSEAPCNEYLKLFPDGPYADRVEVKRKEVLDFEEATRSNTYRAYRTYSREHSNSTCAPVVKERTTKEYWERAARTPHNLTQVADIYAEWGDNDMAISYYEQALALDANIADAHFGLGKVYFRRDLYEKAKYHLEKAGGTKDNFPEAWFYLGRISKKMKDIHGAINRYSNAIELDSSYVECYLYRGKSYVEILRYDLAIPDFLKVVEIETRRDNSGSPYLVEAKQHLQWLQK